MKQNKKYSLIFLIVIAIACIMTINAFAYDNQDDFPLDSQPMPISLDNLVGVIDYSNTNIYVKADNTYYCFAWKNGSSYTLTVVSETQNLVFYYGSDINSLASSTMNDNSTDYQLYYRNFQNILNYRGHVNVPLYDSLNEGLADVRYVIDNPPTPVIEPKPINYTIPAGYAFVADISGLTPTGKITTVSERAFASPHVSNQTIAYVNEIPSSGSAPLGNGISWTGIGNKDLFGRYKSWLHNLIPNPNYNYLVIFNPVHVDNYVDPEHEDYNSSIVLNLTEARSGRLIALNTELTASGQVGTVSSDNGGNVQYDDDTQSWVTVNEDGTPYNPSPYGDYLPNTENSVNDWLKNISSQISGFFTGAISAVTNLVSAGSAFFQVLTGLYGWLPISVLSVLTSALIIVITIGVIKVFL